MTQLRLEPAALRSRVKHSTTEPLCSPLEKKWVLLIEKYFSYSSIKTYVFGIPNRVPTVREKSVKNEKSSRSGKSQGILS